MQQLDQITAEALAAIAAATDVATIEEVRVKVLGKKGTLTEVMKTLGGLSAEERPRAGALINEAKNRVSEQLDARKQALA